MTRFSFGTAQFFNKRICVGGARRFVTPGMHGIALGLFSFLLVNALLGVSTPILAELRIQNAVSQLAQERLTAQRHQAMRELENAGERAVPALVGALASDNPVLRRNAADILSYIVSPQELAALQAGQ